MTRGPETCLRLAVIQCMGVSCSSDLPQLSGRSHYVLHLCDQAAIAGILVSGSGP